MRDHKTSAPARLATIVGGVSVMLGLVDWVMAERFAKSVGMTRGKSIFRAAAAREIITGVAALAAPERPYSIAARLVGDVADIGILGATALRPGNPRRAMATLGVLIVGVVAVADAYVLARLGRRRAPGVERFVHGR